MSLFLNLIIKQNFINTFYNIQPASQNDFNLIKRFIEQFDLDDRELKQEQFLVAKNHAEILGFGRIRKHKGCDEFCSLGVIEPYRFKGVAKALIEARITIATQPIYLVCIIPNFFESFGFVMVNDYPPEIADKLDYCTSSLTVPEKYVVMKYRKQF